MEIFFEKLWHLFLFSFILWLSSLVITLVIRFWPRPEEKRLRLSADEMIEKIVKGRLKDKDIVKLFDHLQYLSIEEVRKVTFTVASHKMHLIGELQTRDKNPIL